jgi:hypothetical protein
MTQHAWISDTEPCPDAENVCARDLVSIRFRQEMNRNCFNARNILILDGNEGGKLITDRFLFRYHADSSTLIISFKETGAGFGSGQSIEVIVTGRIVNGSNESMDMPYYLRFKTC